MKRQRRNRESTAYHEAGHAVAAFVLSLKIGKRGVSIVPDRENDLVGLAHVPVQVRERPNRAASGRTRLHLEKQAIMCFAGDAAARKFDRRRRFGGHRDYQHAAELLAPLATSWEQHDARI
jgi:ATP-dependent Zn protease